MSDIEYDDLLDFETDLGESRKRKSVQTKQSKQPKQPKPTVEELTNGLIFGPYGNGVAYDAKNAHNSPTDPAAAELSDQIFGKALTKTDRAKIEEAAERSGANYVRDAELGTFDDEAWRDAADVIQDRKMQELKDAANAAATAIDENENQEDYENLNDAIAAIDENQTKKRRTGGKGRKTSTKTKSKKSKKSKKQRKQRKNKSHKSSRRNQKK